jgi:hypothetical protein
VVVDRPDEYQEVADSGGTGKETQSPAEVPEAAAAIGDPPTTHHDEQAADHVVAEHSEEGSPITLALYSK